MSYERISVREALDKLNAPNNGWFLPQVQRQYVWGARHESEEYVCLLLDSLLKRYPIGAIVLWETNQPVPYREFIGDYMPNHYAHQVPEGRWGMPKSLVYDGQQRLQTLYSVLRHRFNGRILHFDLLFDAKKAEPDETGFLFRDSGISPHPRYLDMNWLCCRPDSIEERVMAEQDALLVAGSDTATQLLVRKNINDLWSVFVEAGHKSIAYFPVKAATPDQVNEVFRRLNTGGISLTQLELLLGKIKAVYSDYEERLWALSARIKAKSGISFSYKEVLQFFHLMIKKTIRIDEQRLSKAEIAEFDAAIDTYGDALVAVFADYLRGLFQINHASIVPRRAAVLPMAAYFAALKVAGNEWRVRAWDESSVRLLHQYFILSQLCDWNTQTMVNAFAREAISAGKGNYDFPLEAIRKIAIQKNRTGELHEYQLLGQPWFVAKVVWPNRSYVFHEDKPQIDHIFPLAGGDEEYQDLIDVIWNFQPVPAEVNNYKRKRHPREFFNSDEGRKYWGAYDFIPQPDDELWGDPAAFVADRRQKMLTEVDRRYDLAVTPLAEGVE
ncbi:DUF262 domain-containing protein [Metapseudomonas lalkuanensis]|uniref:DUF262 domain-containing protein n=1 Tax=Metapseudomonas lalkuanensis TaxID=2604832 RepID=A0A5J6QTL5_9GAMM|nr:DUF262 domain-containing protein [Pseudomonas lalkuanensis]QEY64975.1 DUF262 domain-containing protein [Pseudomonas lalkuanensis]